MPFLYVWVFRGHARQESVALGGFRHIGLILARFLGSRCVRRCAPDRLARASRGLGFEPMEQAKAQVQTEAGGVPDPAVPRTHLVGSVLSAALLFLPTGLVAVVFAWRTRVLIDRDDLLSARRSSRVALAFMIVTIVVGVVVYAGLLVALLALGAFSGAG